MRSFPQRHARASALAAILIGIGLAAPGASAQDPGALKPYTETIPGTQVKFEMLPIPGGVFTQGSPESEAKRGEDEGPAHEVKINPFFMGKYEVTWDEYDLFAFSRDISRKAAEKVDLSAQPATEKAADAVTRPTPPYADETFGFGRRNQPVICITHHAAMEYTRWLAAKTGKPYRLPTEAEWEYAARAGSTSPYFFGDDPSKLGEYAWYVENAEKPQPIGKKKPSPWGLHDIHGNVAEWCVDLYAPDFYKSVKPGTLEPFDPPTPAEYPYVARGGSWDDDPELLRSAARRVSNKEWSVQDPQRPQSIWWHTDATFVGLRVVCPVEDTEALKATKSLVIKKKGTR